MKNITLSGDSLANNLLILKKEHTGINYVTFFELVKFSYDVEKYLQKKFDIQARTLFGDVGKAGYIDHINDLIMLKENADTFEMRKNVRAPLKYEILQALIYAEKKKFKKYKKVDLYR